MQSTRKDYFIWLIIALFISIGLWANSYYGNIDWAIRAAAWIVLALACLGFALMTTQGQIVWGFAKESRRELRKVSWPDKESAFKTTLVVALVVIAMALILWGIDSILFWLIGMIMS
jgi:preprotein translocase subunit SecE